MGLTRRIWHAKNCRGRTGLVRKASSPVVGDSLVRIHQKAGGSASYGFTLVELLVATTLLALMGALSWRGIDGMWRAQVALRQQSDDVLAFQAGLTQWHIDLDAITELPDTYTMVWDGRALRLLRRSSDLQNPGLLVVAWTRREVDGIGSWLRWQSSPVTTRDQLFAQWARAGDWALRPNATDKQREVNIMPLNEWQIYYFYDNAWSNPLSSKGSAVAGDLAAAAIVPEAIRLVLHLPGGSMAQGKVTRDWIRPDISGGK